MSRDHQVGFLFRSPFSGKGGVLLLFLCYHACWAQKYDPDSVHLLKSVNIIGHRNFMEAPVPAQVLTDSVLLRLGGLSVADAMRYFTGVQLKDYGGVGGLKTINVRAMGSEHTAVFYDGIQLNNAQNGQIDLGRYALDNMEAIQLYTGQRPQLLQPARAFASSSAIYLETRKPDWTSTHDQLNASIKMGSFGLINPSATLQKRLSDRLQVQGSASLQQANGRYTFRYQDYGYDTTAVRQNGDIFSWRAEAALFGRTDSLTHWSVRLYHYQSERGLPRAIVSNRFEAHQRLWDYDNFVQAKYQQQTSSKNQLLVQAKYTYNRSRYLDPEFTNDRGFLNNIYRQQGVYLSFADTYAVNRYWKIGFSTDYQFDRLRANLDYFPYPSRHTWLAVINTAFHTDRLTLSGNILSTLVADEVQRFVSGGRKQVLSPTAMALWRVVPTANLYARIFYKDSFRLPTFNDLYYTFIGNTYLRPERGKQIDLGLVYTKALSSSGRSSMAWQLDVYRNRVTDKIIAIPGVNLFRWSMINLDQVKIKGIESAFRSAIYLREETSLSFGLNYTFQEALDDTPTSDTFLQQIPYIPKHAGSVLIGLDHGSVALNYSFIYTGERYSQKANIPVNYLEPWYTHDMNIHYTCKWNKHTLGLQVELNNIMNQYYDVIAHYPMPGRHYRIALSYQL